MLAKSLIIFIVVGIIAGFGIGIYTIDYKTNNQLVFVDGSSISIVTEKFDFKQDELVEITWADIGEYIKIPDNPVIFKPYDESEKVSSVVPEFIILICINSSCLKSNFSVTIEIEEPSTKTNWVVLLKSIR